MIVEIKEYLFIFFLFLSNRRTQCREALDKDISTHNSRLNNLFCFEIWDKRA